MIEFLIGLGLGMVLIFIITCCIAISEYDNEDKK